MLPSPVYDRYNSRFEKGNRKYNIKEQDVDLLHTFIYTTVSSTGVTHIRTFGWKWRLFKRGEKRNRKSKRVPGYSKAVFKA